MDAECQIDNFLYVDSTIFASVSETTTAVPVRTSSEALVSTTTSSTALASTSTSAEGNLKSHN